MTSQPIPPILYDYDGVSFDDHGPAADDLDAIRTQLESVRREVLKVDPQLYVSGNISADKSPLDAAFLDLPDLLLREYHAERGNSELGRILKTAQRIADAVDQVVVLGIGGSYMGTRALMESCCHPYHNHLSRAARGSRPRMFFEGNNVDNDALAGLIDLMTDSRADTGVESEWGIVVASKSGGTLETAVALRLFLEALEKAGKADRLADLVVPITGRSGRLYKLAKTIGCDEIFFVPDGVGGRFSILSAVGLLPAAILGLDVVRLLQGAAVMNAHFRTAPVGSNAVLDYVGICHLQEVRRDVKMRVLSVWAKSLEATGLWYDQLLAESLGKQERGATPLTVVNTRDLHSRGQQHQEGSRDKLITNVIVENWRRQPLAIVESPHDHDQLNLLAGKTVPEIMSAAVAGTNDAYRDAGRPTANIHLPAVDESSLGQLLQMLMLATVVEGRLIGINPYGQPGVEAYKRNMSRHLHER